MPPSAWLFTAEVAIAVALSWGFMRWLARRRNRRRSADDSPSSIPPTMATPPDTTSDSNVEPAPSAAPAANQPQPVTQPSPAAQAAPTSQLRLVNILRQHAALSGIVALVIAFGAQSALAANQTFLAATGYGIAAMIFVIALRSYVPENFLGETLPDVSAGLAGWPLGIKAPAVPQIAASGFWRNWRYYTVANLLTGTRPALPPEPATSEPAPTGSTATPAVRAEPAFRLPTAAALEVQPARVSRWTGGADQFVEPQAIVVTSQGHVLVVDTGRGTVYRFASSGELLGRWAVPELRQLQSHSVAVSPDGGTLYVADRANRCVQVIALT